ncbi:MAG: CBS domain-containing protein [Alphaproteobacteria bacterium]
MTTVSAILSAKGTKVSTVRPDSTISAVVRRLKLEGIGALVVTGDDGTVLGLISERDIVHGLADHGADLERMRVSELMARAVPTCRGSDSIQHLMSEMTRRRVRHLPVVDGGQLGGIVSIGDVVKNRLEEMEMEVNVLRDYIAAR